MYEIREGEDYRKTGCEIRRRITAYLKKRDAIIPVITQLNESDGNLIENFHSLSRIKILCKIYNQIKSNLRRFNNSKA